MNEPLSSKLSLSGRHALVCGASSGIGRATAFALAGLGAHLTLLARSRPVLESLAPQLRDAGAPGVSVLDADLDDLPGLEQRVRTWLRERGPAHVLIHNTGGPPSGALLDARPDALLAAFRRHVLSAQTLVQLLLPDMRDAGFGRIVNVLSTSVREPIANLGVSNITRAAMAAWSKTLSGELPPGVTINNVLPGYTATPRLDQLATSLAQQTGQSEAEVRARWVELIPEQRLGRPEEIAAAIAFLASPAASYIRGQSLACDGGRLRSL